MGIIEKILGGGSVEVLSRRLQIGIDIGKRHDPSAIVLAKAELRGTEADREESHFVVPLTRRLPLGMSYPDQIDKILEIIQKAQDAYKAEATKAKDISYYEPLILVDLTGVGDPVIDLLRRRQTDLELIACRFVGGNRLVKESSEWKLGKGYLAARLQVLSEQHRYHLPLSLEARSLASEMMDFDIDIDEISGKATYGAIRPGRHDDMVCALGLASLEDSPHPAQEWLPSPGSGVIRGGYQGPYNLPGGPKDLDELFGGKKKLTYAEYVKRW